MVVGEEGVLEFQELKEEIPCGCLPKLLPRNEAQQSPWFVFKKVCVSMCVLKGNMLLFFVAHKRAHSFCHQKS